VTTTSDRTGERIVEAAMQTMLSFGIRRTTMEAIAKRAGVSHMTVYRRWPTRNELLLAVVMREAQNVFTAVDNDIALLVDLDDKLTAGFTGIYWYIHTHPLLGRTLETDPESVLPTLTTGAGPALEMATNYLCAHITKACQEQDIIVADPYGLAETFVRLTHSLLLTGRSREQLTTKEKAQDYARRYILPIAKAATSRAAHPQPTHVEHRGSP
jgi:AcrR family transcriptional regulator